jgi:hypothetical protein
MKGLSSLERSVVECLGKNKLSYEDIKIQTGLHENVFFNIIQALIIRGILKSEQGGYTISENLSPLVLEEINGLEAKQAESLEMMEAVVEQKYDRVFRFQKVALDERDEKIFVAMLSNLESFLADAHKKSHKYVPFKERKVVFWGMGQVQNLMNQIVYGR